MTRPTLEEESGSSEKIDHNNSEATQTAHKPQGEEMTCPKHSTSQMKIQLNPKKQKKSENYWKTKRMKVQNILPRLLCRR